MTIDIAVVPVAGHGTRLLPLTKSQPKEMLSIGRKPVVQYVVEELALSGIKRLLFITSHGKASIEQHFDIDENLIQRLRESGREDCLEQLDFERRDMEYFYTRQRRQLGLGHAVLCASPLVGNQPLVVALGDSIIGLHAQSDIVGQMVDQFESQHADVVVAFEEVAPEDVVRYGIARPRGAVGDIFELEDLVEKPDVADAPSTLAVAARYVFSPAIFAALESTAPGKGGEIQLTDAIRSLLKNGCKGIGMKLPAGQRRYDIGNFDSYFRSFVDFAFADPEYGDAIRAHARTRLDPEG
ncbi:MAG: UTP--glucose-1-phosphate uridylyltransferase [Planctomycetota bacterium]|nr:UTP--glucose-1-phosphate uridylyltransferase [Planctomycetota bacterium]